MIWLSSVLLCFFFQAEDGIRDRDVTGVQTCALPISGDEGIAAAVGEHRDAMLRAGTTTFESKSGYGLDDATELSSLRAIRAAGGIPTWLGAHAVPPEFESGD